MYVPSILWDVAVRCRKMSEKQDSFTKGGEKKTTANFAFNGNGTVVVYEIEEKHDSASCLCCPPMAGPYDHANANANDNISCQNDSLMFFFFF